MLRIAICDDNELLCSELALYLQKGLQSDGGCVIDKCYTGEQLIYEYEKQKAYDIVILDIEMPLMNGLEAGKMIKELDENVEIIILTNYKKYALLGYDLQPYTYLLKPVDKEKLLEICIDIHERKRQLNKGYLDVEISGGFIHAPYPSILFIESEGKKAHIHMTNRVISINKKLSELLPLLDDRFTQIHESFIVNLEHIEDVNFSDGSVSISNYTNLLPISRRRKKDTIASLKRYVYKNLGASYL